MRNLPESTLKFSIYPIEASSQTTNQMDIEIPIPINGHFRRTFILFAALMLACRKVSAHIQVFRSRIFGLKVVSYSWFGF